ncbi:MAG: TIGR00269 family protein [Candidatus Helarchaeales archaeon]
MKCRICKKPATIYLRYCGLRLCDEHFIQFFERKVQRIIKKYHMIEPEKDRILVPMSGGKDSQSLMHVLKKLYPEKPEIVGFHVNLGIPGSSEKSLAFIKSLQEIIDFELQVLDLKDVHGFTIKELKEHRVSRRPICAVCGMVKRYVFNQEALKRGFTKIATGHLLDDEVTVFMSNLIEDNIMQLIRGGPVLPARGSNMIARIKPLYEVSEFETRHYARINGIPHSKEPCPYDVKATTKKLKKIMDELEEVRPNSKLSLIRAYVKHYKTALSSSYVDDLGTVNRCDCGAPTSGETCNFCWIKSKILKELSTA